MRPNILILMADQLRADALACYGSPICQTPNLDRLAGSGVLFEKAMTPNPICVPARATLTGCPLNAEVDGMDLTPALGAPDAPVRELSYAQSLDAPRQAAMVFDGRWNCCYALEGAVDEFDNLSARPDADSLLRPWRERLIAEARRIGDTAPLDRAALAKLPEATPIPAP